MALLWEQRGLKRKDVAAEPPSEGDGLPQRTSPTDLLTRLPDLTGREGLGSE